MKRAAIAVTAAVLLLTAWGAKPADAALVGDVNGDCVVSMTDILLIMDRYGATLGSLLYEPRFDLNGDGRITVIDIQLAIANYGATC
jgi:hypothetical protein